MTDAKQAGRDDGQPDELLRSALAVVVGWGAKRFETFCSRFAPLHEWFSGEEPDWEAEAYEFLTGSQRRRLAEVFDQGADQLVQRARDWSGRVITCGQPEYPRCLHELNKPPAGLHLLGDGPLTGDAAVAVVGSRDISPRAASAARRILEPAAARGMTVVSGGALGADAVAHRAAVDAGAATVVVLPSGIHNPTPKTNRRLFRRVVDAGGLLVSEYPPQTGVRRYHFRRRNSLIAALSRAVMVLRAGESSGTMLTVDAARRLDRPLGAMPGAPDDPLAAGCHDILREGGRLVADSDDLVEWCDSLIPGGFDSSNEADEEPPDGPQRPDCPVLREAEKLLGSDGAFSLEQLARATGESAAQLQTTLLEHELAGVVERVPGGDKFRFCQR